jgi:hypothetical protein
VLGDHDLLVQGVLTPTALTDRIARGGRAVWRLPTGLEAPAGASELASAAPDGLPDPGLFEPLIRQLLTVPGVVVPADRHRRELGAAEVVAQLRQPSWLERQLGRAGDRWVLVITHQPLTNSVGGDGVLSMLDRYPRVVAVLSGHTHENKVEPRRAPGGGYWLVSTASLIDYCNRRAPYASARPPAAASSPCRPGCSTTSPPNSATSPANWPGSTPKAAAPKASREIDATVT